MASSTADAGGVAAAQQGGVERAGKCPAAQERRPEAHAFLVGKGGHFDGEGQAAAAQGVHQGDGEDHAQDAVERAGIGHGIDMRPEQQAALGLGGSRVDAAQVAGRVQGHLHPGGFHPLAGQTVHLVHGWRQEGPQQTAGEFR